MDSCINILNTSVISQFGASLQDLAERTVFEDQEILQTYERAERNYQNQSLQLQRELSQAQSALQQCEDEQQQRDLENEVSQLKDKLSICERKCDEIHNACQSYRRQIEELQTSFSKRAGLVGRTLVTYIRMLPIH